MGLEFSYLAWTYHDGWGFNQTKTLLKADDNGKYVPVDVSKKCHQRGHVHLFLPTVPFSPEGSSLAYSGTQTYSFNVVDEWGPNSNDPNQNMSVRLIGKPIWYVYVEEYWRRMYIQPWDMVDTECDLPLNQQISYTQKRLVEYYHELISNAEIKNDGLQTGEFIDMHYTYSSKYEDGKIVRTPMDIESRSLDGMDENHLTIDMIGYNDFLTYMRRRAARQYFVKQSNIIQLFSQWIVDTYLQDIAYVNDNGEILTNNTDIVNQLNSRYFTTRTTMRYNEDSTRLSALFDIEKITAQESTPKTMPLSPTLPDSVIIEYIYSDADDTEIKTKTIDSFDTFYRKNASRYSGYVDELPTLEEFMGLHRITIEPGCKSATDETILVPDKKTVGHVGIKFDASKPCHSLGPFREGGEFYFFNTVVNRSMPCEYWLDAEKRTRQYFIKKNWGKGWEDTTGGQTWTFAGDETHFVWVNDTFDEAERLLGDDYDDEWKDATYTIWHSYNERYDCTHRLPNFTELSSNAVYFFNGMNAKRLKNDLSSLIEGRSHSDNSSIVHNDYQDEAQDKSDHKDTSKHTGTFTDMGWVEDSSSSSEPLESIETIKWEPNGWTGWYEKGELVKSTVDEKWYRREWSPMGYTESARFGGDQPFWSMEKRQSFPNPPPHLCTPCSDTESTGMFPNAKYDNDEANRIHNLHIEYAMYFNLSRIYPYPSPDEPAMLRRHFFVYVNHGSTKETDKAIFVPVYFDGASYPPPHEQHENESQYDKDDLIDEMPADFDTLIEEYEEEFGTIDDIDTESEIFSEWLSTLGSNYFMRYEDRRIYWHNDNWNTVEITESMRRNNMYEYNGTLYPLPTPVYTVSNEPSQYGSLGCHYQTYVTFNEFCNIWKALTKEEIASMSLNGDMPRRNQTPYDIKSNDQIYPHLNDDPYPPEATPLKEGEKDFKNKTLNEKDFKNKTLNDIATHLDAEAAPSLLCSKFFPITDTAIREENLRRETSDSNPKPPLFTPSPLEEHGDSIPDEQWNLLDKETKSNYLRYYIESGDPIDPFRKGKVNPIDNWKLYFDHRELFTIPERTIAGGDAGQNTINRQDGNSTENGDTSDKTEDTSLSSPPMTNMDGRPNSPHVHPRETSYNHEDGARRHYPDDFFVSPIIEYQKIIRKNWERLPGKEREEQFMQANWKTDETGDWGDGFDITVNIPWKINDEVQSPFSESDNITQPIGTYCHNAVKPEDKMRYHIEFYDSLDQIRKYDFPNYVNIIHDFQKTAIPNPSNPSQPIGPTDNQHTETDSETGETYTVDTTDFTQSLYHEDFNDYEATTKFRNLTGQSATGLDQYNTMQGTAFESWQKALDAYWTEINRTTDFINTPVVRNRDRYGNETTENAFTRLKDGTMMWREQTTNLLPAIDKVDYVDGKPGYIDSMGNYVKAGGVVRFNNPYPDKTDGKWYEECLGALVKARCVLILEDALGYRWQQIVDATALQPSDPIRGSDYDG